MELLLDKIIDLFKIILQELKNQKKYTSQPHFGKHFCLVKFYIKCNVIKKQIKFILHVLLQTRIMIRINAAVYQVSYLFETYYIMFSLKIL